MIKASILSLTFYFLAAGLVLSRDIPDFKDKEYIGDDVFSESIHTVMLRSSTWELSSPVIELGSEQKLELLFDELSASPRTYVYTLVHCDAGWKPSGIQAQEYLTGSGQGTIYESSPSVNTTYDYIHYRLEIPGEDCAPLLSGNYAVVVSDADDPEKIILTRRFYVVEKAVQVTGKIKQAPPGEFRETGQQVEFTVTYGNIRITDPLRDLAVIVCQNGRDDRMISEMKPSDISPGRIEYANPEDGIFMGGNEFRTLDIKSMKYQTENIAGIDFQNPYYHVFLKADKSRDNKPYFSKPDLNGNFFINLEKAREKHLESDYVYVHFCLEQPYPLEEDVYVMGRLADWNSGKANRMNFNNARNCYECVLLLKQGLYDYDFAIMDKASGKTAEEQFEGSFYETGNNYEIYIYLHDSRGRYDRLVGYLPLKTGN